MINRVPSALPEHNVFCFSTVAHISTSSVNLAFGAKSGFKNECRAQAGFGLVISGSSRVQASKWGTFTRGVTRGARGHSSRAANHYGGAEWLRGAPESPNKVRNTLFNTAHLLPKDLRFKHGGAKLASCPRRHLTSLRPCRLQLCVGMYAGVNKGRLKGYILHTPTVNIDWNHFVK